MNTTMPKIGATIMATTASTPRTRTAAYSVPRLAPTNMRMAAAAIDMMPSRMTHRRLPASAPVSRYRATAGVAMLASFAYAFWPARRVRSMSSAKRLKLACFLYTPRRCRVKGSSSRYTGPSMDVTDERKPAFFTISRTGSL